mgnify:CR=1 FL=1
MRCDEHLAKPAGQALDGSLQPLAHGTEVETSIEPAAQRQSERVVDDADRTIRPIHLVTGARRQQIEAAQVLAERVTDRVLQVQHARRHLLEGAVVGDDVQGAGTLGATVVGLTSTEVRTDAHGIAAVPYHAAATTGVSTITAEVPGISSDEIDVKVVDHQLTLRGERRWDREGTTEPGSEQFHRLESAYGKFERSFNLSERIDVEGIAASLDKGILTVKLPKRTPKVQKIKVETE